MSLQEYYKAKCEVLENALRDFRDRINYLLGECDPPILDGVPVPLSTSTPKKQEQGSGMAAFDPDETYFAPAEEVQKTPVKPVMVEAARKQEKPVKQNKVEAVASKPTLANFGISTRRRRDEEAEAAAAASKPSFTRRRKMISPKKHVCEWPRCKQHQPFHESNARKISKMSPETKRMATQKRSRTPPNFWGLDMPSTQEIRERNQSSSDSD